MLLALWPLFISTTPPAPPQDISRLVAQYNEQKYKQAAKHVKLSGSTSQYQQASGSIDVIAQHKVFALGKTGQEQVSVGSITSTNLVNVYKDAKLVSVHYQANVATAQVQESSGTVSVRNADLTPAITTTLSDKPIQIADKHIGLYASSVQSQHVIGKITLSSATPISDADVSTHSLATASTAQVQEVSGKIVTNRRYISIIAAISEQRQGISGSITTNDDDMLMVLMALLELDDIT